MPSPVSVPGPAAGYAVIAAAIPSAAIRRMIADSVPVRVTAKQAAVADAVFIRIPAKQTVIADSVLIRVAAEGPVITAPVLVRIPDKLTAVADAIPVRIRKMAECLLTYAASRSPAVMTAPCGHYRGCRTDRY